MGVPPRVYAALALALASISWAAPLARLAGTSGPITAWWRLLVGSLVSVAVCFAAGGCRFPRGMWGLGLASMVSGVFLASHFALWFESLRYSSIASSTGIVVSYPLIIGVYESLVRREVSRVVIVGSLLGFAGVAVLSSPASGASLKGSILALSAAFMAAAYFAFGRLARSSGLSTLQYTSIVYSSAFIVITAYTLFACMNPLDVPERSIPYLVALGIVPMIGGHTMLNYALAYLPASVVTSVALLEPYGAALIGWVALGERPPAASIPGVAMTVVGAYLALRSVEAIGRSEG